MKEARKINFFIAHLPLASHVGIMSDLIFTMNLLRSYFMILYSNNYRPSTFFALLWIFGNRQKVLLRTNNFLKEKFTLK